MKGSGQSEREWVILLKRVLGITPVDLPSITAAPVCLMVKACFHWVNVYPSIRKEEAHHKQENSGQHGQENNELLSSSLLSCLGHSQCSLEAGWCARGLDAPSQEVPRSSTEEPAFMLYSKWEWKNQQWKYLNNLCKHLVDCTEGRWPESSCWEWAMKRWRRLIGCSVDFLSWAAKMALIYWGTYW